GLILEFAGVLLHYSQIAAAKSSCLISCCSRCLVLRSFITEMRSAWATIFTSATATVAEPQCSGARTATPDFQEQTHSSFIYPSQLTPNITTKPSTWKISRKISPRYSGGHAESLPCETIYRRFRAV